MALPPAERFALAYAPPRLRPRYEALLALDGALARLTAGAREPVLAQVKLAWWRDRIAGSGAAGEHPVLAAVATDWSLALAPLIALIDAWEEVAVGNRDRIAVAKVLAASRSGAFAAAAELPAATAADAARAWSFVTLAAREDAPHTVEALLAAARAVQASPMPSSLRTLAILDGLARRAARRGNVALLGDRLSPLAALRLGIFGR